MKEKAESWAEKHRPLVLDDIVGHQTEIKEIRNFLADNHIDNFLLEGEPGTGKTTLSMIIANEFLNKEEMEADDILFSQIEFHEGATLHKYNASKDRGIGVIRDQIGTLLQQNGKKVFLMDEADMLTREAQNAMRGLMEDAVRGNKMFILTCNHIDQIEEAIQSRCRILRINRLSNKEIVKGLKRILKREKIEYTMNQPTKDFLSALILNADGDMRKAIQNLQRSCVEKVLNTESYFFEAPLFDKNNDSFVSLLEQVVDQGSFLGVIEKLREMMFEAEKRLNPYQAVRDTEKWMFDKLVDGKISEEDYARVLIATGDCDLALAGSATKYIQLFKMMAEMFLVYNLHRTKETSVVNA